MDCPIAESTGKFSRIVKKGSSKRSLFYGEMNLWEQGGEIIIE